MVQMPRFRAVVAAVAALGTIALVGLVAVPGSNAAHASPAYPVGTAADGYLAELTAPTSSPPGVNVACKPSAAKPYPVILLPGTLYDIAESWQALGPLLADDGYCVYGLDYGDDQLTADSGGRIGAVGDIPTSAAQLAAEVTKVRSQTGAAKVDIVGWSQGGMMPRWYIGKDGGARYVHDLVGLASSNHGTTLDGLFALIDSDTAAGLPAPFTAAGCPACTEQQVGSPFLDALNANGDTVAGVGYTVIESDHDEVVTPYTSAFLSGPGVSNVLLQDQCPADASDHLAMPYDPVAIQDVVHALAGGGPGRPTCSASLPIVGG